MKRNVSNYLINSLYDSFVLDLFGVCSYKITKNIVK